MVEKKTGELALNEKRRLIEPEHSILSIRRQCELLGLSRASYYYEPSQESEENLMLMRLLDEQYTKSPFYGSRKMTVWLQKQGFCVNRKRVQRLMSLMGIQAIYQKPKWRKGGEENRIYPYLLRELEVQRANQVWASDITYVPMKRGFMYLVAIIDWYSRFVLSWEVSNTMDVSFCLDALESSFSRGVPDIFNSDQGSQYTSKAFTQRLKEKGAQISMDGRGRCFDNIFIERLWRSVKYEDLYIKDYQDVPSLLRGLEEYFRFYNEERFHQALGYRTPREVYQCALN